MAAPSRLAIIKGITPQTGTTNSFEPTRELIDLLNPDNVTLGLDAWTPVYASLKDGGTFADAALNPGAELLAYSEDKVTEVMKFTVTGADDVGRMYFLSKLARFARAARDQHVTDHQFMPVSLMVQLANEPGPRYALLYDIQIAQRSTEPAVANATELTITMVRHPFWRWEVAPGDTPKLWTFWKRGVTPTNSNWSLQGGISPQYKQSAVANSTIYKNSTTQTWYNGYIEIPAADIPGDAPALVQLYMSGGWDSVQHYFHSIIVGRSSREDTPALTPNLPAKQSGAVPMTIALGTDTTNEADKGCIDFGQSSTPGWGSSLNNRAKCTFVTAGTTYAKRISWSSFGAGTYAVFARALQSGGAQDDVRCYLRYGTSFFSAIQTPETSPVLQTISTDTEFWPLMYFGTIRVPIDDTSMVQLTNGQGLASQPFTIDLWAKRITATGSPTLYLADLILIPIEDGITEINFDDAATDKGSSFFLSEIYYDSTWYLSRGRNTEIAQSLNGSALENAARLSGPPITLKPGVTNRLYFLFTTSDSGVTPTLGRSSIVSDPGGGAGRSINQVTVSLNIVPQSIGPRYE